MSDQAKLIAQITQQVLESLKGQAPSGESGGAEKTPAAPASIHPPIGICTGDYSKFPELANKHIGGTAPNTLPLLPQIAKAEGQGSGAKGQGEELQGQGTRAKGQGEEKPINVAPAAPLGPGPSALGPSTSALGPRPSALGPSSAALGPVFNGIVTAKQLESVHGSIVRLTPSARLTPLAVDYVKQRKLTVERVAADGKQADKAAASNTWLWWIDGACPVVDSVTSDLRSALTVLGTRRAGSALPEAVREIAKRVAQNRAAGAILFVHAAAQAGCLANRCPSLRAIVGTSGEAVEEGLRFLAANVLIVEYPHHGPKSMRALIERFITAERKTLPEVAKLLKELGTCG